MKYTIIVLLLTLTSCATIKRDKSTHNPMFDSYIVKFQKEHKRVTGKTLKVTTPISFGIVRKRYGFDAYCMMSLAHKRNRSIVIDKRRWFELSEAAKEILIYHELGHCELNRMHREDRYDNRRPKSIMSANMMQRRFYERYREEYIKELFTNKGGSK